MEIIQSNLFHSFKDLPQGDSIEITHKLYKDAKSFYETEDNTINEDTIMYTVYAILSDNTSGHLNWGVSELNPVYVHGECNMTRGHFHENLECEEYYWCSNGQGLLMYMNEEGECWCEEMKEGSLHHIDGHYAHRLINTGNEKLRIICVWNGDAGHDYARIEKHPFPYRVFKENDKIVIKERNHE